MIDALSFLVEIYWPYMLGALLVGVGAGWFSFVPKK